MKKITLSIVIICLVILVTNISCKKNSTSNSSSSNNNNTAPPTPTLDTMVNVDLVLVAQSAGAPNSLVVYTILTGQNSSPSTYNSQSFYYPNWSASVWYSTSTPPVITSPCTQSAFSLTMKFSRTAKTEISVSVDVSVRDCIYDPVAHTVTNYAGTFQIDRTCKPNKWVILCSK
jgi:hypothetical protein